MIPAQLLLASQSPRRREMIGWLDLPVRLIRADADERLNEAEVPSTSATRLARDKAHQITSTSVTTHEWVLAADTIVDLDGRALGKPPDSHAAWTMLQQLRGRAHQVHTGVTLYAPHTTKEITACVTTLVWMRAYTDAEIAAYIATNDPLDKAGAYAIQYGPFHPVARLEHCYANVVGLPLCAIGKLLTTWGIPLKVDIPALCAKHFDYPCPIPDYGTRV